MQLPSVGANAAARVRRAFALTAVILAVEVAGGLWANSLALLSDAGHMVTDLLVLGLSVFALHQVRRRADARKTFGYHRVGILVTLFNTLLLALLVVAIVVEAINRLQHPPSVQGGVMLGAAAVALAASLINARALAPAGSDLTVRSALVHIRGDAMAAAGVICGAAVILATGRGAVDPLLSLAIAALIAWSGWKVLISALDILLESAPAGVDMQTVLEAVKRVPGVRDLHDLHVWSLDANVRAMSAHLLVDDQRVIQAQEILAEVREILAHDFGIEHTTIQFEGEVCRPGDVFCVQPDGHPHLEDVHERLMERGGS
jgi:cobalt-zinc-cadmium efflux system protein